METKGIYTSPRIRTNAARKRKKLVRFILWALAAMEPEERLQVAGFVDGLRWKKAA